MSNNPERIQYSEGYLDDDRAELLSVMTEFRPYVLLMVSEVEGDPSGIQINVEVGQGVEDTFDAKFILLKALVALNLGLGLSAYDLDTLE